MSDGRHGQPKEHDREVTERTINQRDRQWSDRDTFTDSIKGRQENIRKRITEKLI